MEFRCRLGTPNGEIVEGVYIADSEARLRRDLEEKGLYVLSLQPRSWLSAWSPGTRRRRISRQEFVVFNQELATLLKAGMPLSQSLDILRQRVENPTFKAVLDTVSEKVKSGTALSDAFTEHGDLFPAVYSASLLAGERSGNLDSVIRRYVTYEKLIGAARRRTISALIYPAILVTMMVLLIGIIVLKVIPAFSDFYATFDRPLPLLDQVRHAGSVFLGDMSPVAVGDYGVGPNAIVPTLGDARRASGLTASTFLKSVPFTYVTRDGIESVAPMASALAKLESLDGHLASIEIRQEKR